MYQYTVIQWVFFFYVYCFLGWCFESAYVSIKSRHPVNRGFMRGPFLPLYGSGAIMMLVVSMPYQDNLLLVYVSGCIGATVLEYVTGAVMEALFKVRYWDYSRQKFNFQGHICLTSTLAWGMLTILMTRVIHKPIEYVVLAMPAAALAGATYVLTAGIGADFALSFKAALDLRDVLVKMEAAREELMRIHERLDAIIAATREDFSNYKENIAENINMRREGFTDSLNTRREEFTGSLNTRMEDLKAEIEDRLESLKAMAQAKPGSYLEGVREEVQELRAKYSRNTEERKRLGTLKDFFQRDLIRSNPTMASERFREALEELKESAGGHG